ncbi:MAG: transporter [Bacteroidales bacterium]|nr:transporter [Bacteroidales bacterium]
MSRFSQFARNWALPISMACGIVGYFIFASLPLSDEGQQQVLSFISGTIQPMLIFSMLFLSFIKVRLTEMKPHRWQFWVLLLQAGCFVVCSLLALLCSPNVLGQWFDSDTLLGMKILCEGAMLAFICPTATASAVITGKLGGSTAGVVTYLLVCNLMVAVMAPALLTLVEPQSNLDFTTSFFMILGKVFPLLICPLLCALFVRYLMPSVHRKLLNYTGLSFNFWTVALALAIAVTVHSIVHSTVSVWYMVGLAIISGLCCLAQFYLGKRVGSYYDRLTGEDNHVTRITAGQAFGQKNTVFIIWLGLVFLNPITSVVGGFYSVWHNSVNSYQLYKARKRQ